MLQTSLEVEVLFANARELVDYIGEKYRGNKALGMPVSEDDLDEYIWYTYDDVRRYAKAVAYYLTEILKLRKGDKVALISENRAEWGLCALGVVYNGFVLVPIDARMSANEIRMILEHSESKVVFISSGQEKAILDEFDLRDVVEHVIYVDKAKSEKGMSLERIVEKYGDKEIKKVNEVDPEDLFEIVYTSGTTGLSKGVMLTHRNIMFEVSVTPPLVNLSEKDKLLSILPLNHTYESTAGLYAVLSSGCSILYSPTLSPRVVIDLISRNKITKMLVVPLFLEKITDAIIRNIEKSGVVF
jgi:long-chain acyl-CoA synthetase